MHAYEYNLCASFKNSCVTNHSFSTGMLVCGFHHEINTAIFLLQNVEVWGFFLFVLRMVCVLIPLFQTVAIHVVYLVVE